MIEEVIDEKEKQDEKPETQIAITTHPSSITRDLIYISKFIIHSFTTIAGSLGDLHLKPVFPILIQTARKIVDWKGHSIEKARHWQKLVPPTIILNGLTPLEISYTAFSFTANYQKILDSELDGYKNNGLGEYYIPDEIDPPLENYKLTGEWVSFNPTSKKVILYIHGGAFFSCSSYTHRQITARYAIEHSCRVFVIDYRLAPEHPFPAALHDVYAAYLYLTDPTNPIFESTSFFNTNLPLHNRVDPNDIIVIGDSAGGALALSLTFYLKDHLKVPLTANPETKRDIPSALPSNLILVSPWLDLSCSFDSWARNDGSDYIFRLDFDMDIHHESSKNPIFWYTLGKSNQKRKWFKDNSKYSSNHEIENIQRILSHPLMSPFFHTKLSGMPRVLIQAGGAEVLIDETVIMAKKLSFHNPGRVRHELFHDMPHVFVFFVMTLAGKQGFVNSRLFVEGNLKNGSDLFKVDSFDNEIFDKVEKEDSKLDLETNF